ncbi:MAG: ABC transporter ATP-binding protein/permease [Treponema sp.]|jgi:ABC-type multidrug transport system fused ATPase/permease subunit|nr:ABC transporter ATP-binding protein/permease [Treponema sp.]
MSSIYKLICLFTKKEQRRLILIVIAVLIVSFLEIVEVGSLGPFIAVASDPDMVNRQPVLNFLYRLGGFEEQNNSTIAFLIFLGITIFVILIAVTAFRTGVLYIAYRFTASRRYTLSVRLFRQYLFQPYQFFLNQNTGELSKNLLSEVDMVVNNVLRPGIDAFTSGMGTLAILIFLVVLNPLVAVFAAVVFGLLYFGLYAFVRSRLKYYGKDARESNQLRYKTTAEAFGGLKDIKILGKEPFFTAAYGKGAKRFAVSQAASQIWSSLPGRIMHSLAIGFAIALIVILMAANGSLMEVLPLMSVYAFAVVRLMPNLQHIFQSAANIRYSSPTIDALYRDMTTLTLPPEITSKEGSIKIQEALPFGQSIELNAIQFSYPASREPVLKNINLKIEKNTTIAFAGTTGCGKTTLVDVLMGLLEPTAGSISVDGLPVVIPPEGKDNRMAIAPWQRNFGYVPQQIYLSDDTVAANIAFGIPENLRDTSAIEHAAKVANLHEFVTRELPEGYNTLVGERGIRLSGGQRQRVGIARALYHNPNILVMDEATSALDSVTEDAVMEAIHNLMHTKTIIIIAHRISTIKECDVIYLMEHGCIAANGTYDELLQNNAQFRALAKAGDQKV